MPFREGAVYLNSFDYGSGFTAGNCVTGNCSLSAFSCIFQTAVLSDDSAETILTALHRPIEIVNIASVVLAVVGITLVLSITFYTIFNFVRSKLGSEKPQKVRFAN